MLAIPVATGVFYNYSGRQLRSEISALLMSASFIIVATNAVLLRRIEPKFKKKIRNYFKPDCLNLKTQKTSNKKSAYLCWSRISV